MSREQLKDKMKNGPALSFVAQTLDISRPTLYRHMEFYMAKEDSKVDPYLKEYFDNVIMDKYTTEEEMKKDLEQIREFMDAKNEAKIENLKERYRDYLDRKERFDESEEYMSTEDRNKELDSLRKEHSSLKNEAKECKTDLDDLSTDFEEFRRQELKWNEGEIKSAPSWGFRSSVILIDADFDRCRDITVELVVTVSGKEFIFKRIRPQENERFVRLDHTMPAASGYRLKWNSGDKVKTTPIYQLS